MKNKWKFIALIEALVLCSLVIVSCKQREHDYDDEIYITYGELEELKEQRGNLAYDIYEIIDDSEDYINELGYYADGWDFYDEDKDIYIFSRDDMDEMWDAYTKVYDSYEKIDNIISPYVY